MPQVNARYSAHVSAIRGVEIRSTAGSFARLVNSTVLSIAPVLLKSSTKILRFLERYAYRGEHDRKLAVGSAHLGLPCYLRGELGMGQTAHGKHGKLLSSYECVEPVYRGNSRLDKFVGVVACGGIYRLAVDIENFIGYDGRAAVAGVAHAVEHSAEHIARTRELLAVTGETRL